MTYTVDRLRNAERRRFINNNLPVIHLNKTIDDFKITGEGVHKEINQKSLTLVKDYLENLEDNLLKGIGLYIFGPVGVGKTMILSILAKRIMEIYDKLNYDIAEEIGSSSKKNRLYRITAPEISEFTFPSGLSDERAKIRQGVPDVAGLWIDDVTKLQQTKTAFEISYLDGLLRHRYDFGLPTFYTSQVPLKTDKNMQGIDKILSEPIYELIRDTSIPVLFAGPSQRGL